MYYTVYKTTNTINDKIYIGTHKTNNLNDDYLGSGTLLKRAIEKYGPDVFLKETLAIFDNSFDMFAFEAKLVTEEFLMESNSYNLKIGGMGGWDFVNENGFSSISGRSKEARKKFAKTYKTLLENDSEFKKQVQETARNNIQKATWSSRFTGKEHSEATKKIMRERASKRTGQLNSQYGTMWITNGVMNLKIKILDVIPEGFVKGRTTHKS